MADWPGRDFSHFDTSFQVSIEPECAGVTFKILELNNRLL
jgi:hypothetical protein